MPGHFGSTKKGFTLIEVMISLAILVIIIGSTLGLLANSYVSLQDSEMRNIAKNIATYAVEYIRSRNVTWPDNPLGHSQDEFYNPSTNPNAYYPGLIDLWGTPLNSNGDADEGSSDKYINVHPVLPNDTYSVSHLAFYYSLQGYVSLGDFDHLSLSDPSPEDANAKIDSSGHYHDKATCSIGNFHGNLYIMRFPFNSTINNGTAPNPDAIKSFTALSNYIPYVYTEDVNKTDPTSLEYGFHYTNDANKKKDCMAYRGFRVLTEIVARKHTGSTSTHVEYYDVKVTVFWISGKAEHSYPLVTQITTYGEAP